MCNRARPRITCVFLVWACVACDGTAPAAEGPDALTAVEELRIGSVDQPGYALSSIGTVLVSADEVFVAQPQAGTINVFSRDGVALYELGRKGTGPGEFLSLTSIGFVASGSTLPRQ